jgi:hypothetical protein
VTGNVAGQRQISGAKSDLLFDILTRLRKEGIMLSTTALAYPECVRFRYRPPAGYREL